MFNVINRFTEPLVVVVADVVPTSGTVFVKSPEVLDVADIEPPNGTEPFNDAVTDDVALNEPLTE